MGVTGHRKYLRIRQIAHYRNMNSHVLCFFAFIYITAVISVEISSEESEATACDLRNVRNFARANCARNRNDQATAAESMMVSAVVISKRCENLRKIVCVRANVLYYSAILGKNCRREYTDEFDRNVEYYENICRTVHY